MGRQLDSMNIKASTLPIVEQEPETSYMEAIPILREAKTISD